jgi:prepilin-type N-terminal cleavage/methylation domain-containing protein
MPNPDTFISGSSISHSLDPNYCLSCHAIDKQGGSNGFTIVELLVVIVVIGILAAITIVSYANISQKANIASLVSDLDNASRQLKLDQVVNTAGYPTSLAAANGGKGIPASPNNTYQYIYNNNATPQVFCITDTNSSTNVSYRITNDSAPTLGTCQTSGIVTDGLVLNLDAGNTASYPQPFTSTAWTDLSGLNNHNGTLMNGVGYNSSNSGALSFDGVDDYVTTSLNTMSNPSSYGVWFYIGAIPSDYRVIFSQYANRSALGFYQGNSFVIASGQSTDSKRRSNLNNLYVNSWNNVVVNYDASGLPSCYINGVEAGYLDNNEWSNTQNSLLIGTRMASANIPSSNFSGKIASLYTYNRTLLVSEILQNFNALKGRYGL